VIKLIKSILYYGVDELLLEQIPLRAGPLTLLFEDGSLRYIRYGVHEVLRRVYVAVRDRNWGTVPSQITNLQIDNQGDSFRIHFDVNCQQDEIDFRWRGEITGLADGELTFTMDGQAYTEFWGNRIGFCVLHPIEGCTGQPCEIEKVDGSRVWAHFPLLISPHQPFKNLRAIRHPVAPGVSAEVRMEGELFEMEDQRNWSDASFKTYCTPLALPFPVWVKAGDRVVQKIQLRLDGDGIRTVEASEPSDFVVISTCSEPLAPFPSLGLGIASHDLPFTTRETERLGALNLSHLRVDLYFNQPDWALKFERAVNQARSLDTSLEIGLHLSANPEGELESVRKMTDHWEPEVVRWLIYHQDETCTDLKWVDLARGVLETYGETIPFGCGADSNFTELNRGMTLETLSLSPATPDFLVYAVNPQVHASDNPSLVENLAGLGETVRSAQRIAGDRAVVVSPVTLKPRFNVAATGPARKTNPDQLPPAVDPRQISLLGAGWTLGALKYLAENSARSVTFYETTGWLGVMETEAGSPLPGAFRSIPGAVFPMYHIFADVAMFAGGQVVQVKSSDSLRVDALALRKDDQSRIWVANLDGNASRIRILNLPKQVCLKILDEDSYLDAVQAPDHYRQQPGQVKTTVGECLFLELKPYAIVRIEIQGDYR